jgi:hypothetical protein
VTSGRLEGGFVYLRSWAIPCSGTAKLSRGFVKMRANDRRGAPRFEIVGSLHGTLVGTGTLAVRDLSFGGALVQSPRALATDSVHTLKLDGIGGTVVVRARVARCSPSRGTDFTVAFDFIAPDVGVLTAIQRMFLSEAHGV